MKIIPKYMHCMYIYLERVTKREESSRGPRTFDICPKMFHCTLGRFQVNPYPDATWINFLQTSGKSSILWWPVKIKLKVRQVLVLWGGTVKVVTKNRSELRR